MNWTARALAVVVAVAAAACGSSTRTADSASQDSLRSRNSGSQNAGDPVASSSTGVAVEHVSAAALQHIADSLARTPRTGHVIRAHPTFQYLQIRRGKNGVPEVHDRWIDVMVVQSGHGNWLIGGRVEGSYLQSAGEHRGGTIIGGIPRSVSAGDLLIIPARVPHQMVLGRGDSIRYLTVKVIASP